MSSPKSTQKKKVLVKRKVPRKLLDVKVRTAPAKSRDRDAASHSIVERMGSIMGWHAQRTTSCIIQDLPSDSDAGSSSTEDSLPIPHQKSGNQTFKPLLKTEPPSWRLVRPQSAGKDASLLLKKFPLKTGFKKPAPPPTFTPRLSALLEIKGTEDVSEAKKPPRKTLSKVKRLVSHKPAREEEALSERDSPASDSGKQQLVIESSELSFPEAQPLPTLWPGRLPGAKNVAAKRVEYTTRIGPTSPLAASTTRSLRSSKELALMIQHMLIRKLDVVAQLYGLTRLVAVWKSWAGIEHRLKRFERKVLQPVVRLLNGFERRLLLWAMTRLRLEPKRSRPMNERATPSVPAGH